MSFDMHVSSKAIANATWWEITCFLKEAVPALGEIKIATVEPEREWCVVSVKTKEEAQALMAARFRLRWKGKSLYIRFFQRKPNRVTA